jgi:hypothetical protein
MRKVETCEIKGMKFDGCGEDKSEMKLRYDLIPYSCIQELAKVYTYGAKKYSDNTWQKVENFENRYWSALQRHLVAWREGEVCDQESGLRHLSHALWNVVALLWNELTKRPEEFVDGSCMSEEGFKKYIITK